MWSVHRLDTLPACHVSWITGDEIVVQAESHSQDRILADHSQRFLLLCDPLIEIVRAGNAIIIKTRMFLLRHRSGEHQHPKKYCPYSAREQTVFGTRVDDRNRHQSHDKTAIQGE